MFTNKNIKNLIHILDNYKNLLRASDLEEAALRSQQGYSNPIIT